MSYEGYVGFCVLKDGKPVVGAQFTMCTKELTPRTNTRATDQNGVAYFNWGELFPYPFTSYDFPNTSWLIFAWYGNDYAIWQDNVKFELGKVYDYNLKKYTKAPTFYLKTECRDIIGAELFAQVVANVQSYMLGQAGFKLEKIEGEGSRIVTVYFTLPFSMSSPIVIDWGVLWKILYVLTIVGGIIAVLVIYRWTFGEKGVEALAGLLQALPWIIGGLIALEFIRAIRGR